MPRDYLKTADAERLLTVVKNKAQNEKDAKAAPREMTIEDYSLLATILEMYVASRQHIRAAYHEKKKAGKAKKICKKLVVVDGD